MISENCPKCGKLLPPPFKSSGRQVCSSCGWSNGKKSTNKSKTLAKPKSKSKFDFPLTKLSKKALATGCSAIVALTVLSWGFASWSDTRVSCKTKDGEAAYKVLKSFHSEWEDAVELAGSTSRMNLPPLIGNLQKIKRKVEAQEWKECAEPAVNSLANSMGHTISALLTFLDSDNPKWMYKSDIKKAQEKMSKYSEEYANLMPHKEKRIMEKKAIAELEELTRDAKESIARTTLGSAIRGQQAYHFDNQGFTNSKSEVYLDDYDDKDYEIKILKADVKKSIIIANAKNQEIALKSYVDAIAYFDGSYERISCETEKPSKSIKSPVFNSGKWTCGSDSIERN